MATGATDRPEFASLYSVLAPRLFRTALGLLGNPHDAADALQEAGLKAFRYYHTLQDTAAALTWFTRILVNACHDQAGRRVRTVPVGLDVAGADQPATAAETDWELIAALRHLPAEQRVTVVLRFFQDMTLGQIAIVMQVPEGTVKSRLHAALNRLRHLLRHIREEEVR